MCLYNSKLNTVKKNNHIPNITFESDNDEKEFEILNLSTLFAKIEAGLDHNPNLPHRIDFFILLIVTDGVGTHKVDLIDYSLKKGTVLKIAKGQVHSFEQNPKYKGYLVLFTEKFVLNYFSKSSIKFISHLYNYHISDTAVNGIQYNDDFITQLYIELETKNSYAQKNIIAAMLELYLLRLERLSQTNNLLLQNKLYSLFTKFKNLVEEKYIATRNVKDYSNMLSISPKLLNIVVKEFTFNTAKHFIDNFVILEIKRAVVSTDNSLKEIGYAVGFDDITNFTKFFKKHTGITPKQFKKTIK